MEQIKQWAVNICITLIVTGVFSMMIPQGSMEKVMKFAVSTFFLCCLLLPFFTGLPGLESELDLTAYASNDQLENTMKEQFRALAQHNIEQVIQKALEKEEIEAEKVEADIHILEDHSVSINRVTVVLNESEGKNAAEIQGLTKQQTGINTVITVLQDIEKDGD